MKDYQRYIFEPLLEKLKMSNIIIADYEAALKYVADINNIRIEAYHSAYKNVPIPFERLIEIYEFDKELRNLILLISEDIEVAIRNKLFIFYSKQHGEYGYLNKENFINKAKHDIFLKKINDSLKGMKVDNYIKNKIKVYDDKIPLTIINEIFTYGMVSKFYADMLPIDKQNFRKLCKYSPSVVESSLVCLSHLRNICAHGEQIYNKIFLFVPKFPSSLNIEAHRECRLWSYVITLYLFFPNKNKWYEVFYDKLQKIIKKYNINLEHIGFPADYVDFFEKEEFKQFFNY